MTTSKMTGISECVLCSPSIIPKTSLCSPSQFSYYFPQHCVCTVLNAMSKHDPAQSVNCVEYSASKNISRYSIMCDKCHSSCIIRERIQKAWNTFSACIQQSNKMGCYVTEKLKIQQFLQEPTYQLSKEPGTDNLHLFCFLLLLQKKSMHPTLITSRKSQKNLKVQHPREAG